MLQPKEKESEEKGQTLESNHTQRSFIISASNGPENYVPDNKADFILKVVRGSRMTKGLQRREHVSSINHHNKRNHNKISRGKSYLCIPQRKCREN